MFIKKGGLFSSLVKRETSRLGCPTYLTPGEGLMVDGFKARSKRDSETILIITIPCPCPVWELIRALGEVY